MFENLLYQDQVKNLLMDALLQGRLPKAMLFHGPAYSGKMTAALEVARVLSCHLQGDWNCSCPSCQSSRRLETHHTLIAGPGFHLEEMIAAGDIVLSKTVLATKFLFYRSVLKLIRRFDALLWKGDETKQKKWMPSLVKIREHLDDLDPQNPWPDEKVLGSRIQTILSESSKLLSSLSDQGLPVNVVRNIASWTRGTSDGHKIVILTKAETLGEGSRNALLKILEEPPKGLTFILLSNQKGAIMPTILSRVREYRFLERPYDQQQDLISQIFRTNGKDYLSFRDFFMKIRTGSEEGYEKKALDFWDDLPHRDRPFPIPELDLGKNMVFRSFMEELYASLMELYKKKQGNLWSLSFVESCKEEIHQLLMKKEKLNMNGLLLLETAFYRLRKKIV